MKLSQNFTKTSKTAPGDEVAHNAQLLIRAGYIHKMMAGVYAYMPLGLKVIENIKQIVREEMNVVGGQEVMMTALQPRELWERTDRWDDNKVDNWFKTTLKNGTELGVGLSHEEPIVDALRRYASSYKDFPLSVYQIQTKFRNELRAKSGLLRGREFIMKDMYSFARTEEEHLAIYEKVAAAYLKVYERLGIGADTYRCAADGGYFTDKFSDEFQTLTDVGEDTIYVDEDKRIAVNKEVLNDETLNKLGLDRNSLVEKRAVEVGNIFPLESKYSDALDLYYTDETGQQHSVIMGCYGIGISRVMGVIVEKFADEKGIVWPESIAPARVYLVQIGEGARSAADALYDELTQKGVDVIYDDRDERPGTKFADAELIGIPYRVTVSERLVEQQKFEFTPRKTGETELLTHDELIAKLN